MAKFRIYNIQLLPQDDVEEVGVSGYKRLFARLRDENQSHLSANTHLNFHYPLKTDGGDIYIGPWDFHFPSGYVTGHFVRYRKTDKVTALTTGKTLFESKGKPAVSTKHEIPFVFDANRHLFAIDAGGNLLPSADAFVKTLFHLLGSVAAKHFPNHTLTINLISRAKGLEEVFNTAVSYKTAFVYLNGPNGDDALDVLGEMRDSKMHKLTLDVSGGDGRMIKLPEFVKKILRSVPGHGWSTLSYFVSEGKPSEGKTRLQTYDSREQPLTFTMRHGSSDKDEEGFLLRAADTLSALDLSTADSDDESAK